MEKYSIGKVAKAFGFTKEALRFYERTGILIPQRNENGYRYYTRFQLQRVAVIKRMQNIGFSLKEIAAMLTDYSQERLMENLRTCIAEKERALAYQEVLLERLQQDVDFYGVEENYDRIELVNLPEQFVLYFDDVDKLVHDETIRSDILCWYDRMYPALGIETVALEDMGGGDMPRRIGLVAESQAALASGLEKTRNIEHWNTCRAVHYCTSLSWAETQFEKLRKALEEAAQRFNVAYQGQVHVVFNFSYRGADGKMVYLVHVYAPIVEHS